MTYELYMGLMENKTGTAAQWGAQTAPVVKDEFEPFQ